MRTEQGVRVARRSENDRFWIEQQYEQNNNDENTIIIQDSPTARCDSPQKPSCRLKQTLNFEFQSEQVLSLKTNDKIRKLTNDIFENWWIAYSYRMLHMTEMASPDITFVWKMWGLEFQWLYHWSQWEYAISDKRVERFCWNLLWLIKIIYKVD